jgi:hypothetical protein
VVKITGQRSYQPPSGTQLIHGSSACDYDSANLTPLLEIAKTTLALLP